MCIRDSDGRAQCGDRRARGWGVRCRRSDAGCGSGRQNCNSVGARGRAIDLALGPVPDRFGGQPQIRRVAPVDSGPHAMIAALIRWSLANRFLVLLATLLVTAWGVWAVLHSPLDALPDLCDVYVIIH